MSKPKDLYYPRYFVSDHYDQYHYSLISIEIELYYLNQTLSSEFSARVVFNIERLEECLCEKKKSLCIFTTLDNAHGKYFLICI